MEETIKNRIKELTVEVQEIVAQKEEYQRIIKEMDIRVAQLIGAISELNKLIEADEKSDEKGPSE